MVGGDRMTFGVWGLIVISGLSDLVVFCVIVHDVMFLVSSSWQCLSFRTMEPCMLHQNMGIVSTKVTSSERLDQLAAPYKFLSSAHAISGWSKYGSMIWSVILSFQTSHSLRITEDRSFSYPMKVLSCCTNP